MGLPHLLDSFACSPKWDAAGPRRYGVAIASRFPLTCVPSRHPVPWAERLLSAAVATARGTIHLHTTHVPPGATNGWMKVQILEAIADVVSESSDKPCTLCGDFNTPQFEMRDGRIVTWGEEIGKDGEPRLWKQWQNDTGRRWDAAERTVPQGGRHRRLSDAYRHLHSYERQEFSWFVKRKTKRIGRRFDHAFARPASRSIAASTSTACAKRG